MPLRTKLALLAALLLLAALAGLWWDRPTVTQAHAEAAAAVDRAAYTLPPARLRQARALTRTRIVLTLADTLLQPLALLVLLASGGAARLRNAVLRLPGSLWLQGYGVAAGLLATLFVATLPLRLWGHVQAVRYGLSVERWPRWCGDLLLSLALEWAIAGALVVFVHWALLRWPRRWWLVLWPPFAALVLAGVFLKPYLVDPLFDRFTPLQSVSPALVARLEQVAARGRLAIPPGRMYLMRASARSTQLNAYVTGFGASKRVVVWDTTLAAASPDDVAYVFAHEMGHYELGHVLLGSALACAGLLPFFWLGHVGVDRMLLRFGARWRIRGLHDWAALPLLAFVLLIVATLAEPLENAISRRMEHDADIYAQEAVYTIVADPQQVGLRSFQALGSHDLDDPTPHPIFDAWFSTHPSTAFRAAFASAYRPWAPGMHAKYIATPPR